ncbi:1-acyl-sn-glycerol-3-phosphate acyltransferase [Companilactobacillus huachuanensis]|uniref:1-acyl-sn-glycerol-3-phosphate acyltransferase n=1 Tax=Companilactobacillus huachuanensis TaxID=2559914 RepID=A0ABW1RQ26_9LACO|nr:1-acyl-sn-glycerol-3-phosphate acyltransferase [Companilactobacillus huachuanensis]
MNQKNEFVKTYYYETFSDDFVGTNISQPIISKQYRWTFDGNGEKGLSQFINALLGFMAKVYVNYQKINFIGCENLQNQTKGYVIYGNHTQINGDVLLPNYIFDSQKLSIIVNPANLEIPVIGRLIKFGGGLPIPKDVHQFGKFKNEIDSRLQKGGLLMIYPEAHVWPYATKIRPFSKASFHFPVENNLDSFCVTTTYQKSKYFKRPRKTIFIDGPFHVPRVGSKKENQTELEREIRDCMINRAKNNTYEYICYKKRQ